MNIIEGDNKYSVNDAVEEYAAMLYRLAMTRMKQKEDAEEVVQDTFLKLVQHTQKGKVFRDKEHLKAWLLTVAINRGKSILTLIWNTKTEGMDNLPEAAAKEDNPGAYEYVMRLSEKYRIVIDLFYYEGLSTQEISKVMKMKLATVRSYLLRGREKLKEMMEKDRYVG